MKDARIFLGDLWQKLLDSTDSVGDRNNGRISKIVADKNKCLTKLPSPDSVVLNIRNHSERRRSEHREDYHRYRSRYSHSRSSYSRSTSYRSRYHNRRRSSSHHRRRYTDSYHHHRSRSSSGHTPYTRYSDYTNEEDRLAVKEASNSPSESSSASSATSSSSSSSSSASSSDERASPSASPDIKSRTMSTINIQIEDAEMSLSDRMSIHSESQGEMSNDEENHSVEIISSPVKSKSGQSRHSSKISKDILSYHYESSADRLKTNSPQEKRSIISSIKSHRSVSPPQASSSSSSASSSSSEYTIEYVEKTELITADEESSRDSDDYTLSDIEWVTAEEYERMFVCASEADSGSHDGSSSSEESVVEVVWLEEGEIASDEDSYYCRL